MILPDLKTSTVSMSSCVSNPIMKQIMLSKSTGLRREIKIQEKSSLQSTFHRCTFLDSIYDLMPHLTPITEFSCQNCKPLQQNFKITQYNLHVMQHKFKVPFMY